ncbi:MAG: ribosome-associated translation inhibitor RaiA [Chitinophagales bacterium]|jgi:putative sigma-54 modulation protein|nr:ribosome-associated translation inhibitor RaiA [Chitinophagales bacterium]
MNLNINTSGHTISSETHDYIKSKISKLGTFHSKLIKTEVFLKKENKLEENVMEISCTIPNKVLHASQSGNSFEQCVDLLVDQMAQQLKKNNALNRNFERNSIDDIINDQVENDEL